MLIVHCGSGDDDLRAHAVEIDEDFDWSFEPNGFGTTLFWCNLAVEGRRLSFVAYDQGSDAAKVHYWVAYDDGLYGKVTSTDGERFMGKWK
ncbi:unnamed protein product [Linum tenue]|uniref:S-protein homolog n=1 Tax=Linum tenue TaxID=586396 RepID=A0AAV0I1P2_9ROSI|nr:unnamed protein product [Linum tenue]